MARKVTQSSPSAAYVLNTIAAAKGTVLDFYLPVGHGKTAISLTAPFCVPGCQKALLVVPPAALRHFQNTYERMRGEGDKLPSLHLNLLGYVVPGAPVLRLRSHTALSKPDGAKMLAAWEPDLIICDQWAPDLARHRRLFDYVETRGDKLTVVRWMVGP